MESRLSSDGALAWPWMQRGLYRDVLLCSQRGNEVPCFLKTNQLLCKLTLEFVFAEK